MSIETMLLEIEQDRENGATYLAGHRQRTIF